MSHMSDILFIIKELPLSLDKRVEVLVDIVGALEWELTDAPKDSKGDIDYEKWEKGDIKEAERMLK